jgi:hypothetical protein
MSTTTSRRYPRLATRLLTLGAAAAAAVAVCSSTAAADPAAPAPVLIVSNAAPFATVSVAGGSTAQGARIVIHDVLAEGFPTDGRNRWIKIAQPDGSFLLQNAKSKLCIQSGFLDPTVLLQLPCAFNNAPLTIFYQKWRKVGVDPVRPNLGRITHGGNLTWDLAGTAAGSNVIHSTFQPGKPSQIFNLA